MPARAAPARRPTRPNGRRRMPFSSSPAFSSPCPRALYEVGFVKRRGWLVQPSIRAAANLSQTRISRAHSTAARGMPILCDELGAQDTDRAYPCNLSANLLPPALRQTFYLSDAGRLSPFISSCFTSSIILASPHLPGGRGSVRGRRAPLTFGFDHAASFNAASCGLRHNESSRSIAQQ